MKRKFEFSFNVAYCGIMCALSTIVMFIAIIPSMTYIMPAISGIIIWSVNGQINRRWAFLTYAAAAALTLLLIPEMEAKTFFVLIFGYYPLLREIIHEVAFKPVRFVLKLAFFNVTAVIAYLIIVYIVGVADVLDGLEGFGEYAIYALWIMGNLAFFFYDYALNHIFFAFRRWIKPYINKKIK